MEAMILAAGAGTRLRPLTDRMPKALVPVRGRPLLAHVLERLVAAGATRVVVNTCRHGDQIAAYLAGHTPPGVEIRLSPEPDGPWDTGGGFRAAAHLFGGDGPVLLHAVDVLSRIPLASLLERHHAARARHGDRVLATLAVQQRQNARRLLFDDDGLLGRARRGADGAVVDARRVRAGVGAECDRAFAGIHVVEPAILGHSDRTGAFSLLDLYLDAVARGSRVEPADMSAFAWQDVGTPERLREAESGDW